MRKAPRLPFGPRLTPAVTWLIAINVATFLAFAFSGAGVRASLVHWLVLTPGSLLDGHVWKLLSTSLFTTSTFAFVLDLLILWMFMPFLEGEWGTRRFVRFAVITSLVGNLVGCAIGLLLGGLATQAPISGMSPFVFAAMVGYGMQFGDRNVQFFGVIPMKGKTLAIGMAAVLVLVTILNQDWVFGGAQIGAMAAAWFLTSGRFTPRLWVLQWRRARLRKRYTVLDGGARGKKQWLN